MKITFSPQRRDDQLSLARHGDVLVVNGVAYDFSPLPEGATLPREAVACSLLASDVERREGVLHLTLILPHGPDAPPEALFPPLIENPPDGPIRVPHSGNEENPA